MSAPGTGARSDADAGPAEVLLLGDPGLRLASAPVTDHEDPGYLEARRAAQATLAAFRRAHGFGRAIAAPQIGVAKRFIALDLEGRAFVMANPEIGWRSEATFTLWDDCMSFPDLLVRVRRHRSVSVRYEDERGDAVHLERLDPATSELLQHEIDHLDGVLAIDRAIDRESIVWRSVFERDRARFDRQVDGPRG